jgi:hypothetical protein
MRPAVSAVLIHGQPVTDTRFGQENTGCGGVFLYLLANLSHKNSNELSFNLRIRPPDGGHQLSMCHHAARVPSKGADEIVFAGRQPHLFPQNKGLPGGEVHLQIAASKAWPSQDAPLLPPQGGAESR